MLYRKLILPFASCVVVIGIAACVQAAPAPTPTPAPKERSATAVSLQEVDGGPDYYARFSHALPSAESYFPIGVWLESVTSQADVDMDQGRRAQSVRRRDSQQSAAADLV